MDTARQAQSEAARSADVSMQPRQQQTQAQQGALLSTGDLKSPGTPTLHARASTDSQLRLGSSDLVAQAAPVRQSSAPLIGARDYETGNGEAAHSAALTTGSGATSISLRGSLVPNLWPPGAPPYAARFEQDVVPPVPYAFGGSVGSDSARGGGARSARSWESAPASMLTSTTSAMTSPATPHPSSHEGGREVLAVTSGGDVASSASAASTSAAAAGGAGMWPPLPPLPPPPTQMLPPGRAAAGDGGSAGRGPGPGAPAQRSQQTDTAGASPRPRGVPSSRQAGAGSRGRLFGAGAHGLTPVQEDRPSADAATTAPPWWLGTAPPPEVAGAASALEPSPRQAGPSGTRAAERVSPDVWTAHNVAARLDAIKRTVASNVQWWQNPLARGEAAGAAGAQATAAASASRGASTSSGRPSEIQPAPPRTAPAGVPSAAELPDTLPAQASTSISSSVSRNGAESSLSTSAGLGGGGGGVGGGSAMDYSEAASDAAMPGLDMRAINAQLWRTALESQRRRAEEATAAMSAGPGTRVSPRVRDTAGHARASTGPSTASGWRPRPPVPTAPESTIGASSDMDMV